MSAVPLALLMVLANIGASRRMPATGELSAAPTPIEITAEQLTIACDDEVTPRCEVRAVYELENPSPHPESVEVKFVGERTSNVRFDPPGPVVTVERRLTLTVSATMTPGRYHVPSYGRSAVETRHMLLGSEVPRSGDFDLEYAIAPLRTWGAMPKRVAVRLIAPAGWALTVGEHRAHGELTLEVDPEVTDVLPVRLTPPRRRWFHGGPFFGAGAAFSFGAVSGTSFRARLGYEIAAPEFLFISLALETDFVRYHTVVPVVHVASEGLLTFIPSASLGVGVPIDLAPSARAGVRLQVTVHWPFFGVVFAADGLLGAPIGPPQLRFSLMGQVGL